MLLKKETSFFIQENKIKLFFLVNYLTSFFTDDDVSIAIIYI